MPSALVLYHYLYPDDVVSSVHMSELCAGLVSKGWTVTAVACNRGCRDESQTYPAARWQGVDIRRVWRPPLRQASKLGRLINAGWMIARWSLLSLYRRTKPDVVIIGTDPVLSVLSGIPWKRLRRVPIAHWCFDLYPEAAIAGGMLSENSSAVRAIKRPMSAAYRNCNLIVDLGPCMRRRLDAYKSSARQSTILPWALAEPCSPLPVNSIERHELFGEARLALLYSGNFGRAHDCENTLALARSLKGQGAQLLFSVRGNQESELRSQVTPTDTNIRFAPFAQESRLEARLSSADVLVVSLRPSWTGAVVPSKFFGALAIGRPVLFEGSEDCSIAHWIREHQVGWVLNRNNLQAIAAELLELSFSPDRMAALRRRCHALYHSKFSRARGIDAWDRALRPLTGETAEPIPSLSQPASVQ